MLELFKNYTVGEVIIFIIIFALGIKQAIEVIDWFKNKIRKSNDEELTEQQRFEKIEEHLQKTDATLEKIRSFIKDSDDKLEMLIGSDKDAIKAYIIEKHHHFCYVQKWIDDYTMDCLERRYKHYVDEKGNSYVLSLMENLRKLPRVPQ